MEPPPKGTFTLQPLLDRVAYYAPVPICVLEKTGAMVDYNLAYRLLHIEHPASHGAPGSASGLPLLRIPANAGGHGSRSPADANPGETEGEHAPMPIDGEVRYEIGFSFNESFRQLFEKESAQEILWEDYSCSYDRIVSQMPYYTEVLRRHLAAMKTASGRRILDLGAGTGNLAVALAKSGHQVVAIDNSRAMLQLLQNKMAGRRRSTEVEVRQQSAELLPGISSGSFDGVSVLLAFFAMNRPAAALSEAIRVLRSGGTIAITEPKQAFQIGPILAFCRDHLRQRGLLREYRADLQRVFRINEAISPENSETGAPLRAELIAECLRAAGFANVTALNSHFGQCATITGQKPTRVRWHDLRFRLPLDAPAGFSND